MADRIDYQALVHDAMRGLIARVLAAVGEGGLPGEHHFFIAFDTADPGVRMANWLRARYPDEMTIVLQHWFEDLWVGDDAFTVTLNFGNRAETLTVPFAAIRTFVDPSAEFGLRFDREDEDTADSAGEPEPERPAAADAGAGDPPEAPFAEAEQTPEPPRGDAEIVRLDRFRK